MGACYTGLVSRRGTVMHTTLELVLVLLGGAVAAVWATRLFGLPTLLGYMAVGVVMGPHALELVPATAETRHLAEFGVVFLMFSIGLEFSLAQLKAMQRLVFGLGAVQVAAVVGVAVVAALVSGLPWTTGVMLGGALAMSSTAIVSRLLVERRELATPHGQQAMGVLLFQDLAVVPLLILLPAFAEGGETWRDALLVALFKAAIALVLILYLGQRLMRPWFALVAARKTPELFMLNVLLVTLGLAWLTEAAALSLALGAFLAGVLISETEYRYQVEADIKPFRDVLMGLFFVTVGMQLDLGQVARAWPQVLVATFALIAGKGVLMWGLARLFGARPGEAVRSAAALAQAGEFGLVLLTLAKDQGLLGEALAQTWLAAMLLSMALAPFLIQASDAFVGRLLGGEWEARAAQLHDIAVKTFATRGHAIVCGYGRSGQILARLLEEEGIPFIALDLDPARVKQAAAAGERVVYGDASRPEVLTAAGLARARAVIVTYADVPSAMKVVRVVREARPGLPVVVRTLDDAHMDELVAAGAQEVVPEVLEGSLMLAAHALMLLGVPISRVVRRVREVRERRYSLLKAFFLGTQAEAEAEGEALASRLYPVTIAADSPAVGKTLGELELDTLGVRVTAIRRHDIRGFDPEPDTVLEVGDTLILLGRSEDLLAAEARLLG